MEFGTVVIVVAVIAVVAAAFSYRGLVNGDTGTDLVDDGKMRIR